MSQSDTLRPWREDGAPELLHVASAEHRARGPSEAQLECMLSGLEERLTTPEADAAQSAGVTRSLAPKFGLAGVVLIVGIGLYQGFSGLRTPVAEPAPDRESVAPAQVTSSEPPAQPAPLPPLPDAPEVRTEATRPRTQGLPKRRLRNQAPEPPAPVTAEPPARHTGIEEFALLNKARRKLLADPAAALAFTDEHAAQFPRGTFVEEREVLAIEALTKLGRRAEAAQRAATFERARPASLHLRRIEVILHETP